MEHAKKLKKSKSQKLAKSQKSSKLRKLKSEKLSKGRNLSNFNIMEVGSSFLIPNTRTAFNYLWLTFIKTLILCYFNLEYYIWIKIDTLSYAISRVLN